MTNAQFTIPAKLLLLQNKLFALRKSGKLLLQNGDRGTASAPSNIALIKYWGKSKTQFQIPDNPSLSFTLENFRSYTRVTVLGRFFPANERPDFIPSNEFYLFDNESKLQQKTPNYLISNVSEKLNLFLKNIMHPFATDIGLKIESVNNFPTACGLASSASGMAALCRAIANLLNLEKHFSKTQLEYWLTQWARLGSGSAGRSAYTQPNSKFVSWELKESIEPTESLVKDIPYHKKWENLRHCVFILNAKQKAISSSDGHGIAQTSPLHAIRVNNVKENFSKFKKALKDFDFSAVASATEQDAINMHAVMQTCTPSVTYLDHQVSLAITEFLKYRQKTKIKAFWTLDAGPNIHFLYLKTYRNQILKFHKELSKTLKKDIKIYE